MPNPTTPPNPDDKAAKATTAAGGNATAPAAAGDRPAATTPAAGGTPALALPPEPKFQWLAGLREITTTVLAAVILSVSMVLLWRTFNAAGNDFSKMKDILLYALPILGTVLGYYFGRVPAERRAEASEQRAGEAQVTAQNATAQSMQTQDQTNQKLQQVRVAVERAKAKEEVRTAGAPTASVPAGGGVLGVRSGGGSKSVLPPSGGALDDLNAISNLL